MSLLFSLQQTGVCKQITNYLLPIGWSLEKGDYVKKLVRRPLDSMKIGVVRDTKCFLNFWELVLKGAGARVFGITPETSKLFTFH
jgi:hypothetical protein